MTQKLPLNQTSGFTTLTDTELLIHTLADSVLWNLHAWFLGVEGGGEAELYAVPKGAAFADTYPIATGAAATKVPFLLADKIPLRGPLDVYARVEGGAATGTLWGYVSRGEVPGNVEERFLDGSAIGDQQSDFTGGQAIVIAGSAAPPNIVDVQDVSEQDRIDVITLDARPSPIGAGATEVSLQFDGTGPLPTVALAPNVVTRLLDGIPFRNAGQLRAQTPSAAGFDAVLTGSFVRQ